MGPSISCYELWHHRHPIFFLPLKKWSKMYFSTSTWQMMSFLIPLDALIPKISFSFLAKILVRAPGSVLVGFLGARQLSPLRGGVYMARNAAEPPSLIHNSCAYTAFSMHIGQVFHPSGS